MLTWGNCLMMDLLKTLKSYKRTYNWSIQSIIPIYLPSEVVDMNSSTIAKFILSNAKGLMLQIYKAYKRRVWDM